MKFSAEMLFAVIFGACLLVNISGQRIAGGNPVPIEQFPFAVSLVTNNGQGSSYSHACGGTIITANAVLSAASCFYTNTEAHPASWWRARVGTTYSNSGGTIYMVNRITSHPDFSPTTQDNDLAVVRTTLSMAVVPGSVEVARLAGAAYTFGVNMAVRAIGWGAQSNQDTSPSAELREVQFWAIDQQTCTNRYNATGFTVTANMVCVGWLDVGIRGQCQGDAGSPLLDGNDGFVTGVFSRAEGCAQGFYPNVNTRVSPYIGWIVSAAYAA